MDGHLLEWALGLGFFMEKDGSVWAQFCLLGLRSIFGTFVCGSRVKSNVTRGIQNPTSL